MTLSRFAFPTTIHFGPDARKLVGPHLREAGLRRPLVVTDKGLATLPLLAELKADLAAAGLEPSVFGGVWGNPTGSQVMAGAAAYKAHGADCVVGIGGGAALDVAKVVGVLATHPGDVMEYVWDHPKVRPIGDVPHFVALPTTSGTGSEVGRSSVISEEDTHVKRVIFSAKVLARVVFADPLLTLGLPPAVTAATGMDALTHNVESYLSPAYHPLCDGIALEGTRIASRALVTAVREPGNIQARADMMMSSMMGAIAFQKDLGAVPSCAHALGTVATCTTAWERAVSTPARLERAGGGRSSRAGECCRLGGGAAAPRLLRAEADDRHRADALGGGREARVDSAPGRDRGRRHLPPDQPAAGHGRRLRATFRGGHVAMTAAVERVKVGISACFFHPDPKRPIFTGKTLQYVEQSIAHWVMSTGAIAVMIPSPVGDTQKGDVGLDDYAGWLDALCSKAPPTSGCRTSRAADAACSGPLRTIREELCMPSQPRQAGAGVCRGLHL